MGIKSDTVIGVNETMGTNEGVILASQVACFVGDFIAENLLIGSFMGFVNRGASSFYSVPSARYEMACASGSVALDVAIIKIRSGEIDVAIVAR